MASVVARVRCVVEVPVGTWNGKATFDELAEQVRREGAKLVEDLVKDKGGQVVCPPRVVFVRVCEGDA